MIGLNVWFIQNQLYYFYLLCRDLECRMCDVVWCSVSVCSIVRCVGVGAMSLVSKCPHHRVRKYFKLISIKHVCPPVSWHVPHAGATCAPPPAPINQISPPRVPATSPASPAQPSPAQPGSCVQKISITSSSRSRRIKTSTWTFITYLLGARTPFIPSFCLKQRWLVSNW